MSSHGGGVLCPRWNLLGPYMSCAPCPPKPKSRHTNNLKVCAHPSILWLRDVESDPLVMFESEPMVESNPVLMVESDPPMIFVLMLYCFLY